MTNASQIPLSNDDEDVIHRELPSVRKSKTPELDIEHVYEVRRTVQELTKRGSSKVALQFPDELLIDAAAVVSHLQGSANTSTAFYVLGDTSYGSCCVDEVAAEHVSADIIVHYGRSCLSPTSKLPVIYIFGRLPLALDALLKNVKATFRDKDIPLMVVTDTTYMSSHESILQELEICGYRTIIATSLSLNQDLSSTDSTIRTTLPGRVYSLPADVPLSEVTMLYIGPPSPTLTTTLMTHTALLKSIYSYNPLTSDLLQETTQNIALRRRYAVVQKARDAGVIGIVVGTLGVSRYLDLIQHLRVIISKAEKKSYLFAMGKLNPSKMANFSEIDVFVLVACGENSLVESRDFHKPVVTPFELSLALKTRAHQAVPWTGDWITDFQKVLSLPEPQKNEADPDEDNDAPHFSLITGQYSSSARPMYAGLDTASDADYAIATKSNETTVGMVGGLFSPAASHLQQRKHWGGLGTDHEDTPSSTAAELTIGRHGLARDYAL